MPKEYLKLATEMYRGVLVRNLTKDKATEFLVYSLPNKVLMDITNRSATFVSLTKNGKRTFNNEDKELLYQWYKEVSEFPLSKEEVIEEFSDADREVLYTTDDVRDLENILNLTISDIDRALLRFKQDTKKTLRITKKNSKKN